MHCYTWLRINEWLTWLRYALICKKPSVLIGIGVKIRYNPRTQSKIIKTHRQSKLWAPEGLHRTHYGTLLGNRMLRRAVRRGSAFIQNMLVNIRKRALGCGPHDMPEPIGGHKVSDLKRRMNV